MVRRLCLPLLFLLSMSSVTFAQVVDVTVCDVLADPVAFNGKMVRMKAATAVAGFDEFIVDGSGCTSPGAIWLAYPNGTKGKAGPVSWVRLQLAKNAASVAEAPVRTPVTLQRDKQFARFDSMLATPFKSRFMCLGCPRYMVSATMVGRLDAVDTPGLRRDNSGKVTGLSGFGNLNMYRARLVLQSVSEVVPHEIDYAAATMPGDSRRAQAHATPDHVSRATAAYGAEGDHNGVIVGMGVANEVVPDELARGTSESPDGVLFHVTFDMDRLNQTDLSAAMMHNGTHIADIRGGVEIKSLSAFEDHAWRGTFK